MALCFSSLSGVNRWCSNIRANTRSNIPLPIQGIADSRKQLQTMMAISISSFILGLCKVYGCGRLGVFLDRDSCLGKLGDTLLGALARHYFQESSSQHIIRRRASSSFTGFMLQIVFYLVYLGFGSIHNSDAYVAVYLLNSSLFFWVLFDCHVLQHRGYPLSGFFVVTESGQLSNELPYYCSVFWKYIRIEATAWRYYVFYTNRYKRSSSTSGPRA